ncbi:MAG: hypothetical protein IJ996_00200 [Clostridia bacterium]|nr:hypothetical protein [Clostridia bacterium]
MHTIKGKKLILTMAMVAVLSGVSGMAVANASAEQAHGDCEGYCLVCDVAEKINALPDKAEINVDNVATAIQQIHDIDRIKYDLTDEQFDELSLLVDVGAYGYVTKYYQAIDAIRDVDGGVDLRISKSLNLGEETLQDTSQAEIAFSVTNVATAQTTVLTMFDLGVSTSELGMDYYELTSDGWAFTYRLPAGTYEIKELYTQRAVTVNGRDVHMVCTAMEENGRRVNGNGITVTLTEGGYSSVSVYNSLAESVYTVQDANGNGIEGVRLNSASMFGFGDEQRTTGASGTFILQTGLNGTDTLTVESVPEGYCKPDPIAYELTEGTYGALTIEQTMVGFNFTVTLQTHSYTHGTCDNCGDVKDGDIHEYVPVAETPATCTEGGIKAHYRCTGCDLYFDENKQETTYENLRVGALGHDYGEWVETKPATETQAGERQQECSRCHDKKTEEIPVKDVSQYNIIVIGSLIALAVVVALVTALASTRKK